MVKRRIFIRNSAMGLAGATLGGRIAGSEPSEIKNEPEVSIKEYRRLGRTGFMVSDIGCGMSMIREENLLKAILERGVNYIDTAKIYQNGNNERMIGRAIKGLERESIFITTKVPVKREMSVDDIVSEAQNCLDRLESDYIDCFQMHSPSTVDEVRNPAFREAAERLKKRGIIRFTGVSCHGQSWYNPSEPMDVVLDAAIDEGIFDQFLLVYNYVQREMAERILLKCRERDIATTLMKTDPFGGNLSTVKMTIDTYINEGKELPPWMKILNEKINENQKNAIPFMERFGIEGEEEVRKAAIRFVLSNPDAHSALISFKNISDIGNYIGISGQRFTYNDSELVSSFREVTDPFYCRHACGICESSCPHSIPINTIMRYNHYFTAQGREKYAISEYHKLPGSRADRCTGCSAPCQEACPYGVKIHTLLGIAHSNMSLG